MKIQYLSIVFIIIALPIILVTSVYNRMQIKTLQLQKDYDDKLITASYDAIKAFQINTEDNESTTVTTSRIREIEAVIDTFFTSLSTGLGVGGYGTSYLKPYVPAMLITLYDGYYIYSPTLITKTGQVDDGKVEYTLKPFNTYSQRYVSDDKNTDVVISYTLDNYITIMGKVNGTDELRAGYLNYYLRDEDLDALKAGETLKEKLFVIKESFTKVLDRDFECWEDSRYMYIIKDSAGNYYAPKITISDKNYTESDDRKQSLNIVGVEKEYKYYFDESTYTRYYLYEKDDGSNIYWFKYSDEEILNIGTSVVPDGSYVGEVKYGISNVEYGFDPSQIGNDNYVEPFIKEYPYYYENSQKIYYDENLKREFTYLDGTKRIRPSDVDLDYKNDISYYNYATESIDFTNWVKTELGELKIENIVGSEDIPIFKDDETPIFAFSDTNKPEEMNSLFGTHKREVIKLSIETNLLSAINNYDKNSVALDMSYHFKMPVIQENEWDRILSNVSLVTFLQGLPVGFKTYNNYAIVTSSTNQDYITDDTIYFINDGGAEYHRIGCSLLDINQNVTGYRNSDFERFKVTVASNSSEQDKNVYYYRQSALPCYYCVVNRLGSIERNIFDQDSPHYTEEGANERRLEYYQAIGRERFNVRKDIIW